MSGLPFSSKDIYNEYFNWFVNHVLKKALFTKPSENKLHHKTMTAFKNTINKPHAESGVPVANSGSENRSAPQGYF